MQFEPIFFKNKIAVLNPEGFIGVVTLWSKPQWVIDRMEEAGINLSEDSSPIAAVGTLYGNGLPELLRNLLNNPQISVIIICGKDKSGSAADLCNFFRNGLEEVEFLGEKKNRILGTTRFIDNMVSRQMFLNLPEIHEVGDLKSAESMRMMKETVESRFRPESKGLERKSIPLPHADTRRFPSDPRNHNVVAKYPLDAWRELIFRLVRFGHVTHLRKGDRLELQNVRVVVNQPGAVSRDALREFGIGLKELREFRDYYQNFLNPQLPPDYTYTYGHRMGSYFRVDSIEEVAKNLNKDPEDRKSYVSLWDTGKDLAGDKGHPCLVSLYFRKFDGMLTLTATFRTHNAMDAWMKNYYGLLRAQNEVSSLTGIEPGPITIISHSISVDPRRFDMAKTVADKKKFRIEMDPMGNFSIETADGEIVVRHYFGGVQIDEYRGTKAMVIGHQMAGNCAVSDISHAIYLGRMLERAQKCLEEGREFIQE